MSSWESVFFALFCFVEGMWCCFFLLSFCWCYDLCICSILKHVKDIKYMWAKKHTQCFRYPVGYRIFFFVHMNLAQRTEQNVFFWNENVWVFAFFRSWKHKSVLVVCNTYPCLDGISKCFYSFAHVKIQQVIACRHKQYMSSAVTLSIIVYINSSSQTKKCLILT